MTIRDKYTGQVHSLDALIQALKGYGDDPNQIHSYLRDSLVLLLENGACPDRYVPGPWVGLAASLLRGHLTAHL